MHITRHWFILLGRYIKQLNLNCVIFHMPLHPPSIFSRKFPTNKFELAEKLFNKYGGAAVFIGRLLPGVRTFISFPAGMARYSMTSFFIWTVLGTIPWTILLVWLGKKLGENWKDLIEYNHEFLIIMIAIFVIIGVVFGVKYYRSKSSNRNQ